MTGRNLYYKKTALSTDARGTYFRCIGYTVVGGAKKQAKFYLGNDPSRAKAASGRLELLWRRVAETQPEPYWDAVTYEIAKAVARGEARYVLTSHPEMADPEGYVHWIGRYARAFGDIIPIVAESEDLFASGLRLIESQREEAIRERIDAGWPSATEFPRPAVPVGRPHETLHHALDEYIREHEERAKGRLHEWPGTLLRQAQSLKEHHPDFHPSALTLPKMEEMARYWENRPNVRDRNKRQPIAPITAREQFSKLKHF
jgi:hypothetical protein